MAGPVQPGASTGKGKRPSDPWGDLDAFNSLTQREKEDMNTGDANNSHFNGGGGSGGSDAHAAPKRTIEEERQRFKLPDTVQANICFDFSNGDCRRGASCRFDHVNGGGPSMGRLCYHCNKRGHISKECPKKLAEENGSAGPRMTVGVSVPTLFGGGGGGGGVGSSSNGGGGGGGSSTNSNTDESSLQAIFRSQLTDFLSPKNNQSSLEFPSTLNSAERRAVHELATQLGLEHTSKGIGTQRRIIVWRKGKPPPGVEQDLESADGGLGAAPKRKAGGSSLSVLGVFNRQAKRARDVGGGAARARSGGTGWAGPA